METALGKIPPPTTGQKSFDPGSKQYVENECDIYNSLSGNLTGYDCQKCRNRGYTYKPAYNDYHKYWSTTAVECQCMEIRKEIERRQKSGLNKLTRKYTLSTYRVENEWQKNIAKGACDYVRSPKGWFFIGGQVGCGKTHICTAIVNALISRGRVARYMVWPDEITAIKQAVTDAAAYSGLIKGIQKVDILYIDDFFKKPKGNSVTSADVDNTFKIINYRYNEELPTIISSELSISEIIDIDEALGSRIAEMAGGRDYYVAKDTKKNYRYRATP